MVDVLLAAAIAAASPAALPAQQAHDSPAIFVVRDADTTIYIFGTFHALDAKTQWFNEPIKTAFDQSQELVLETLIPETPAKPSASNAIPQYQPLPVTPSASFLATTRMAIDAGKS